MTVPATTRRAGPFNGNDSSTSFPFTFRVFSKEDVQVQRTRVDGVSAVLVLDSDYTVTVNADQDATPGGSITYPVSGDPLATGERLVLIGAVEYEQTTDLPSGGAYRASVVEDALDRTVMQVQQLAEELGRSLTLPATSAGVDTELPVPTPGNVIGWDEAGLALRNLDPRTLASIVAYANKRVVTLDGGASTYVLDADPGVIANTLVVVGGVAQTPGVDYTLSGTTLTPTTPFPSGTGNVVIFYGEALPVGTAPTATTNWRTDVFTGNGSTTSFTLSRALLGAEYATVAYNGSVLTPNLDYTVSGATLALTFAPLAPNDGQPNILVRHGREVSADTADASNVSYTAPRLGATTLAVSSVLGRTVWIEDFGADPTGSVLSTAAIIAAVTSLTASGGTVLAGPGTFTYDAEVQIPPWVNVSAAGLGATTFKSMAASARFNWVRGSADGRGGESGGFTLNGNNLCPDPLVLGVCVEREFRSIDVHYAAAGASGITLNGTQNCNFYGVHSQNNAGANLTIDYGAGNNRFFGCELSRAGTWGVRFLQSGASPSGAFTAGPTSNRLVGCILERAGWVGGAPASADTANGLVYHGGGRFNSFVSMDFSLDALTSTNKPLVLVEKASGSYDSVLLNFHDCNWSGTATRTTAVEVRANTNVHLSGRHTFENHAACFSVADTGRVYGLFSPTTGGVVAYFTNQGGGTQPQQNLILSEMRGRLSIVSPSGFVAQSVRADGATYAGLELWPDRVLAGDGTAAADRRLAPVSRYTLPGWELNNGGTQMVVKLGAVDLLVLTSAPTQAAPNGSLAVNTAGGGGSTFYVRESGAWVAK